MAERRHRPMPGHEGGVVAHRPEAFGDRADELLLIATFEVPPADRALEEDVADQRQLRLSVMEYDVPWRVAGAVANVESELAYGDLVAVLEPTRRLKRAAVDAVLRAVLG